MLYHRSLLRFCLFLTVFSFTAIVSFAAGQQADVVQPVNQGKIKSNVQAETPADFLRALYEIDPQVLNAMLEQLKNADIIEKQQEENKQRMAHFTALPEDVAQQVKSVNNAYQDLADLLRVENALGNLCTDLEVAVNAVGFENPADQQALLRGLGALKRMLKNGLFKKMSFPEQLPGGPEAQLLKELRENFLGKTEQEDFCRADVINFVKQIDDLVLRLEGLVEAISRIPDDHFNETHIVLVEKSTKLVTILNVAKQRNSKSLSSKCIQLLEPEFQAVIKKLTETISMLVDTRIQLGADADQKLKDALDYWMRNFKAYRKTLKSFLSLTAVANIDLSFILCYFSQIYDIASIFFRTNPSALPFVQGAQRIIPSGTDSVIRASLAVVVCLHTTGEIAIRGTKDNPGIEGYLLGQKHLEKFINPFDEWESILPAMVVSIFAAQLNPTMFADRMHRVTRALCRIVGACLWHGISESNMIFKDNPGTALRSYQGLRIAMRETIKEAQGFLDGYLEGIIADDVDPIILEKIEKFSMGLVKPELINLSLEIIVPMIFLNAKIVDFRNDDFFPHELLPWSWLYVWPLPDRNLFTCNTKSSATVSRFYAEYRLIHYACTNIGRFLGSTITKELHIPVLNMLMGVAKMTGSALVNVVDLFYPEDVNLPEMIDEKIASTEDRFNDDFSLLDLFVPGPEHMEYVRLAVVTTEKGRAWLKKQIVLFFQEKSELRMIGIEMLKALGFLKAGIDDPHEINYRLIATLLYYLTSFNVFSHSQNAELLEDYIIQQRKGNIEPFIDHLIEQIKGNVAGWAGGMVGATAGSIVANKIVWEYRAPALGII